MGQLETALAAERIENTRLREAFRVMERAANQHEADLAAARKLLGLFIVDCGFLHHAKADQHMSTEPCPVEARIMAAKEQP